MTARDLAAEYLSLSADFIDEIEEGEDIADLLYFEKRYAKGQPAGRSAAARVEASGETGGVLRVRTGASAPVGRQTAVAKAAPRYAESASVIDTSARRMTPANFMKSVASCGLCSFAASRERTGLEIVSPPLVLVLLDFTPDSATVEYLDKIMASIKLFRRDGGFGFTSLVKCVLADGDDFPLAAKSCFGHLKDQISLICPKSIFAFGPVVCRLFRENGARAESGTIARYGTSVPVVFVEEGMPLDIAGNKPVKHRLWTDMQAVEKFLSLSERC